MFKKQPCQNPQGIYKIEGALKNYDWGSPDWIPELLGRGNPERKPCAELWLGTHPGGPARLAGGGGAAAPALEALIASRPDFYLGKAAAAYSNSSAAAAGGGQLPFLLKVLAAEKPLSIQAHPNREQARAGFAKENSRGIPLDAPERNYKDAEPKPEIIYALSRFTALCGFRPVAEIKNLLNAFGCPFLAAPMQALNTDKPENEAYAAFLRAIFALPNCLCGKVSAYSICHAEKSSGTQNEYAALWDMTAKFAGAYPHDPAVIAPLFLNVITLEPGEAFFVPPATLHAYVRGLGIEVMGASDNVLRGGLTSKYRDIEELLSILRMEAFMPNLLPPPGANGAAGYGAVIRNGGAVIRNGGAPTGGTVIRNGGADIPFVFSVVRACQKPVGLPAEGPALAFAGKGSGVLCRGGQETVRLKRGESVFIAAGENLNGPQDISFCAATAEEAVLYMASAATPAALPAAIPAAAPFAPASFSGK